MSVQTWYDLRETARPCAPGADVDRDLESLIPTVFDGRRRGAMSMVMRNLSRADIGHFYDQFGARQDKQDFYEGPALNRLMAHLDVNSAKSILEIGCGTGKLASDLLDAADPATTYLGIELSTTMAELSRKRLLRFGSRADVRVTDGTLKFDLEDKSLERVIATYVVDLLSDTDADCFFAEAARVLKPGGLLGLVSLTNGHTFSSSLVSNIWKGLHFLSPFLVGGCQPVELRAMLDERIWSILYHDQVTAYAIPSEIVVAQKV